MDQQSSKIVPAPAWHRVVLLSATLHCLIWGVLIMASPVLAAKVYGFAKTPNDLHLWQGTGLFISLLGIGYFMAARDPAQHWGLVFIGLLAKVMGAGGMTYAVFDGQVSSRVLWLLPINDVIWWLPFWIIFRHGMQHSRYLRDVNSANAAGG